MTTPTQGNDRALYGIPLPAQHTDCCPVCERNVAEEEILRLRAELAAMTKERDALSNSLKRFDAARDANKA